MPRPGGRGPGNFEKSKDFKGSMIRLIKNLKPWKYLMGLALSLAMISAILALGAPNRLSKFADLIGEGLVPDTEMLQNVGERIYANLGEENFGLPVACFGYVSSIDEEGMKQACTRLEQVLVDIEIDGVIIPVRDQIETLRLT